MRKLFITAVLSLLLVACDDVLSPDISDKEVAIIAPADHALLSEGKVGFRWDALAGADKYRLVVVSPDFEKAWVALCDTVLYQDSLSSQMSFGLSLTLTPADYQWSVQASNFAYSSKRSVRGFTVTPKEVPEEDPEDDPEER